MKVISNSSPLINFAALDRFDTLCTLYGTVYIPDAVYDEVVIAGRGEPGAAEVERAAWLQQETVSNPSLVAALHELGLGEAEAIALAVDNVGSLLILDDHRGRLIASSLGVNIVGTLGVLLIAKRKGLIEAVTPEITTLQARVGFRIDAELRSKVLLEAGESDS